ncbi:MAG: hypothetical protein H7249_20465 [Chitinophagaceae bacterium]|nr:hypothetical protein [Oligoflexus sp.]
MKHINAIQKIVDDGHFEEAHLALENLLEMGPSNVEAIKLKAALFAHVGRFDDEELAWRRIIDIDNEDEDAIDFYQRAQLEDREHYYFTDALPSGGRRYLAYSRAIINTSFLGICGCMLFLGLVKAGGEDFAKQTTMVFSAFLATVIAPWFAIVYTWLSALNSISLTTDSVTVATRMKKTILSWQEIDRILLAHSADLETSRLQLVILPKNKEMPSISIDITDHSSAVRARRHLLAEVRDHFPNVQHDASSQIVVNLKNHLRF